jgi:VAD1 Analog of StAR-related lipid transfer domain/GRAM domain
VGTLFGGRSKKGSESSKDSPTARVLNDLPLTEEPGEKTPSPKKGLPTLRSINVSAQPADSAPHTFITPPTPVDQQHSDSEVGSFAVKPIRRRSSLSEADLPSSESVGHRRTRSNHAPSKLSNSISVLSPAVEEVKTPGGTFTAGPSSGFFSNFISAAQNAATSISNTITVGSVKNKGAQDNDTTVAGGEEVILSTKSVSSDAGSRTEKTQKPAVETLGLGNLSLSHLGIVDSRNPSPTGSQVSLMDTTNQTSMVAAGIAAKKEDNAASRAVSKAYEKTNGEKSPPSPEANRTVVANDDANSIRRSIEPEQSSIKRAGSVRSKLSNRRRRTRGSSVNTTGGNSFPTARFTAAAPKRNRDFHNTFKSVPEDDQLIEDYAAALQKEILLQGRLYISEGHVCFWSNIFGYVTTLIISFDEIISVEKKSTAMIFANGIVIQTLHARNVFASLLNRDATYELIVSIWKVSNPNLKSSLNGNPVEGAGTGDKTEKVADGDDSASEEIYDEDDESDDDDDEGESYVEAVEHSAPSSDAGDAMKQTNRKVSANVASAFGATSPKSGEAAENAAAASGAKNDFPGPASHEPTDCGDASTHYEKLLMDATIPAPLGKIYSLVFGSMSPTFMRRFLTESEKAFDFQVDENDEGLSMDRKVRKFQYIRPLNGNPLGPKQTKCIITETLDQLDYEKAISISCNTSNPDVPSGGSFMVKTRYCLMWAPGNATRMLITYTVHWSGRSLIKGKLLLDCRYHS